MSGPVVAWYCELYDKTLITSGFVASNRAYVEAHKNCNWRALLHPDVVAELIEAVNLAVTARDAHETSESIAADQQALVAWDRVKAALTNVAGAL